MDDREPTPEEMSEAEALARALERGSGRDLPDDALGAAALLRYASGASELPEDRQDAVLEDVLAAAGGQRNADPGESSRSAFHFLRWLLPTLAAAGLAAVVVTVTVSMDSAEPAPTAQGTSSLPVPARALLMAQAAAGAGSPESATELREQMRAYRGDMYATLSERYRDDP